MAVGRDRAKAALAGADVSAVGLAVQMLTNGVKVGEYRPDRADDAVDIRVKYPEDERRLMALEQIRVATSSGMAPITSLLKCDRAGGRDHSKNAITTAEVIRANVSEGYCPTMLLRMSRLGLKPKRYTQQLLCHSRNNEEQEESQGSHWQRSAWRYSLCLCC